MHYFFLMLTLSFHHSLLVQLHHSSLTLHCSDIQLSYLPYQYYINMVSSHSYSSLKMPEVCYGSIVYLCIYATFNKARVFHTPHFNLFAQKKLAQGDYVSVILYGKCLLHLKLPDLTAIYN